MTKEEILRLAEFDESAEADHVESTHIGWTHCLCYREGARDENNGLKRIITKLIDERDAYKTSCEKLVEALSKRRQNFDCYSCTENFHDDGKALAEHKERMQGLVGE